MADFGWWARLREVRFGRLALVYAGASWAVLEATGFFIDNFGFPQWLLRAELVLLAVGLVIVVATAIMQVYRDPPEPGEDVHAPWEIDVAGLGDSVRFRRWPHLTWARTLLGGVLAFSLLFAGAALHALLSRRSTTTGSPDPQLVAIMPFRVTGDPSLSYLGEGMIDLLAAKLSGDVGPRAADPRLVLNAWRREKGSEDALPTQDEALELARRVGARYAMVGGIVGTPHGLVVNAKLLGGARLVQSITLRRGCSCVRRERRGSGWLYSPARRSWPWKRTSTGRRSTVEVVIRKRCATFSGRLRRTRASRWRAWAWLRQRIGPWGSVISGPKGWSAPGKTASG